MTKEKLEALLINIAKKEISEYHLTPGAKPFFRQNGRIQEDSDSESITPDFMHEMKTLLIPEDQLHTYESKGCYELAYSIKQIGRFRMRFNKQRSSTTLVILVKSTQIPNPESLGLTDDILEILRAKSGLLIVTGETKSNKSTTIASLLNNLIQTEPRIITTVENPIEYLLPHGKGIINQMEVGVDIQSVAVGLEEAVNNHSDIIYVKEASSKREWQLVFDALEKGFYVIMTMNSNGIEAALDHMLFNFTRDEQPFIKRMLANHLNGMLYELNLESMDKKDLPVYEVLLNNKAVKNMFLENKLNQLPQIFKAFPNTSIKDIDMAIAEAVLSGRVDRDYALTRARQKSELIKALNGAM